MDYEKKYKEALERAKDVYTYYCDDREQLRKIESIFPELAESEDEKISREITEFILIHRIDEPNDIEDTNTWLAWLEKQGEQIDKGEISDGYHTFNELYYYRMLYNAAFFNLLPKEWTHKSKRHHDGEECFGGGWFIVMANLPTGQISNHYELKDWDLFQIPEKEMADEWDGHTPQEAAERLHKYLEKQAPKTQGKTALEAIKEEKLNNANYCSDCTNKRGCINCENGELKETLQTSKWSEEDEHHWMMCLECVEECATQEREDFSKTISWLKSIKQRLEE